MRFIAFGDSKSKEGIVLAPIDVYHFLVFNAETDYIKVSVINSKAKN